MILNLVQLNYLLKNNNIKKMKNLISFKEFKSAKEVSDYEVPDAAVKPAPNDKIWYYMKNSVNNGPLWGHKLKNQEKKNQVLGLRSKE